VVVFSDGVSEALNTAGEEFGDDRIIAVAQGTRDAEPMALLDALVAAVKQFAGAAPQGDDVTALVVSYRAPGA
jgi:sigma-B regulation protein RsbU (phosphoserine phosphatase)